MDSRGSDKLTRALVMPAGPEIVAHKDELPKNAAENSLILVRDTWTHYVYRDAIWHEIVRNWGDGDESVD